jgi:predicted phage baseplate assembly protein
VSFPRPDLDDRRFQDLVDEAKRMIPRFLPEWTNHNVSDPGVALIELFAWMTELTLYRLNRVPDRVYTSFLDLVGVSPYPAVAARADVTFAFSTVPDETVLVPAGSEVSTSGDDPIVFSTVSDLLVAQPERMFAWTAPSDGRGEPDEGRTSDVQQDLVLANEVVRVFPSDPVAPGDAFYLGFRESLGGYVIRVDVTADVEGIGVNPTRPPLVWEVWTADGWLACRLESDSTGGLNRDGSIQLAVPMGHLPLTVGSERAFWLRLRLLAPGPDGAGYRTSPLIRDVVVHAIGGTAPAEHAEPYGAEYIGISSGQPTQAFDVQTSPVLPRRDGERVELRIGEVVEPWTEVTDFSRSGPDDRHYTWDSVSGRISFGPRIRQPDGSWTQHGAIPPAGAAVWVSGYRRGGGARGNVGPGALNVLRSAVPYVDRVTNPTPATGGIDPETLDNAKLRAPLTLVSGGRAVTAGDHERLAKEASPRVSRSLCVPPTEVGGPSRLLVVPDPGRPADAITIDDLALDDDLYTTLRDHLEPRRVIGTSLEIGTPTYLGVSVAAMVRVQPGRAPAAVRQRCLDAIATYLSPHLGGPQGDGWPFGLDVTSGAIANLLGEVPGVEQVEEIVLFESDLRNGQRIGGGVDTVRLADLSLPLSFRPQVVVR